MVGKLTAEEIESLLRAEVVGRIGYIDRRGLPCIVPITYAYDGKAFYGYSLLGAKIENMGAHPKVCVEVDRVVNAAEWASVIARGIFERLDGDAAIEAVERISDRLRTLGATTDAPATAWRTFVARAGGPGIAYRIRVAELQGRYSSTLT